jgi:hypothetical protein
MAHYANQICPCNRQRLDTDHLHTCSLHSGNWYSAHELVLSAIAELQTSARARQLAVTLFAMDDHEKQVNDIDSNAHDVYQELFRLKASLEVAPIPEDPAAIALHLKHMRLANRSAFDDVVDLVRLKSAIARCMSAATDSSRLNQNRMIKEQALEALHMDIRMRQHVPRRLKPQPKVTSQW